MARKVDEDGNLKCSFCGRSQQDIEYLIVGPGVYICDECIELCSEIIQEKRAENNAIKTVCYKCLHGKFYILSEKDKAIMICVAKPIKRFSSIFGEYDAWSLCNEKNWGTCPDFEDLHVATGNQEQERGPDAQDPQALTK